MDGFVLCSESYLHFLRGSKETSRVAWREIVRVTAYKMDDFAWDTIWLAFESSDANLISIPEDALGWKEFIGSLPTYLVGFPTADQWLGKVSPPPFATNETVLYAKVAA